MIQKSALASLNNQRIRLANNFPMASYLLKWLTICFIISIPIGSASAIFITSLNWVTNYRDQHLWIIALLPFVGFVIGWVYHQYGKNISSGNNLLIENLNGETKKIPLKMTVFIYFSTLATHLFGGSAGREGTALQMAGGIADVFSKPFKLNAEDRRTLITASIAAGFGSVFGTPLAGAVFAIEFFVAGKMKYNAIFPAFIASILANLITHLWGAVHTVYIINLAPEFSFLNFTYAIIAGIAFGLCAKLFSRSMLLLSDFFKLKIKYPPMRPLVGGFILVAIVYTFGDTQYIGLGIPTIVESFSIAAAPYDFLLKLMLTVLTLAAGFKGGEVTPLFFIGATLGSALALVMPLPISLLAAMGFVAVFSGATNTPLACTIMGLELFGSECAVYIAIACVIAYLFSGHTSIYQMQKIGEPKHARYPNFMNKRVNDI